MSDIHVYTAVHSGVRGVVFMWLKIVILVLLTAIVVSLFSGAFFLRDAGSGRQLFSALALRISLTVVVMLLTGWGLWSGQLQWGAPWRNCSAQWVRARRRRRTAPPRPHRRSASTRRRPRSRSGSPG